MNCLPAMASGEHQQFHFFDEISQRYDAAPDASTVEVTLNGVPFSSDMPAVGIQGRTLVPVRAFCEALGYTTLWLSTARQVVIFDGYHTIALPLGSQEAFVNGVRVPVLNGVGAQAVRFQNAERTLVPLRFLVEALGGAVDWNGTARVTLFPMQSPRFTAVIDAGHGGNASGASFNGLLEKDLVLPVALRTAQILREAGIGVLLTRSGDESVNLYERAEMANAVGADLFLSIHANAAPEAPHFAGTFTYSYPGSAEGAKLAQAVQQTVCAWAGMIDQGILTEDFVVLRETVSPAALLETGFMSCPEELARLADPTVQEQLAKGTAEGILNYLT